MEITEKKKFYPLVSIIIPVYNGSNFLSEAIDCALGQTYKNIEVIVVNDGSCDEGKTEVIAKKYGDKIRYYKKENGGVSTALNLGISCMQGEYFSWLSHDDKYTSDKIERQIALLSALPETERNAVCLCESLQIDKNSEVFQKQVIKKVFSTSGEYEWTDVLMSLLKNGTFNGCALLIPKSAFDICGGFDESLRYNQDSLMWIKICLARFRFLYSDQVGAFIRIHQAQLTQTGRKLFHVDCEKMSKELLPSFFSISTKENNYLYAYAKYNAKYNNPRIVKQCIAEAEKKKLFSIKQLFRLKIVCWYGKIRPAIRKLYYRICKKVKTE